MKNLIRNTAIAGLMMGGAVSAPAMAQDVMIGQIIEVGFNFCPRGFAATEGQLLPIRSNESLFSLLGTTYGGDGRTTFALPDFRNKDASTPPPAPAPAPVGASVVTVYQHCDYKGWSVELDAGTHAAGDLPAPYTDKNVSSMKVPHGMTVKLYESADASGIPNMFNQDASCLVRNGYNDLASSFVVTGAAKAAPPPPVPLKARETKTCIAMQGIYPSRN